MVQLSCLFLEYYTDNHSYLTHTYMDSHTHKHTHTHTYIYIYIYIYIYLFTHTCISGELFKSRCTNASKLTTALNPRLVCGFLMLVASSDSSKSQKVCPSTDNLPLFTGLTSSILTVIGPAFEYSLSFSVYNFYTYQL